MLFRSVARGSGDQPRGGGDQPRGGGDQPRGGGDQPRCELDTAAVTMVPIDPDLLERYLATGESLDKAGAYAVQGEAAAFVASVNGHITTVVGLPVRLVERLVAPFGLLPTHTHP